MHAYIECFVWYMCSGCISAVDVIILLQQKTKEYVGSASVDRQVLRFILSVINNKEQFTRVP